MSPKEVARVGEWGVMVHVTDGTGYVWICQNDACTWLWRHGFEEHRGGAYEFSVEPGRHWWGARKRTVSEAIMLATDEALRRHTQDLADASAAKIAEELAEEIGTIVRERLEVA